MKGLFCIILSLLVKEIWFNESVFAFGVRKESKEELMTLRKRRELPFPEGSSVAIKWLITFPVRTVTKLTANLQFTHLIEIPFARIYPSDEVESRIDNILADFAFVDGSLSLGPGGSQRGPPIEKETPNSSSRALKNSLLDAVDPPSSANSSGESNETEKVDVYRLKLKEAFVVERDRLRSKNERKIIYKDFVSILESIGLVGTECLLHAICDIAKDPFSDTLMGELFTLIMTPSFWTSYKEDARNYREAEELRESLEFHEADEEYQQYLNAESMGKNSGSCDRAYSHCLTPILHLIESIIENTVQWNI